MADERKGAQDARILQFRWLLEELRVSFWRKNCAPRSPSASSGWRRLGGS